MSLRSQKGATLLEVCVSLLLLVFVTAWVTMLYSGIFFGSQTSDRAREAIAAAETIAEVWKDRARDIWPEPADTSADESIQFVPYGDYFYAVEDRGMVRIPDGLQSEDEDPPVVDYEMKRLRVSVRYQDTSREGQAVTKTVQIPAYISP